MAGKALPRGGNLPALLGALCAFGACLLSTLILAVMLPGNAEAVADAQTYGPDGYFNTLEDDDNDGAIYPIIDADDANPQERDGWLHTRRILFGKQRTLTGSAACNSGMTESGFKPCTVSAGYKTIGLARGAAIPSESLSFDTAHTNPAVTEYKTSSSTSLQQSEALLFAEGAVTAGFWADNSNAVNTGRNVFDNATYRSRLATFSGARDADGVDLDSGDDVTSINYSAFEQSLMRLGTVEGVCGAERTAGCTSISSQTTSSAYYRIFPLSSGDLSKYFNHTDGYTDDANLKGGSTYWLRSAYWSTSKELFTEVSGTYGRPDAFAANKQSQQGSSSATLALRPATRVNLSNLILSAKSTDQSQNLGAISNNNEDSLRLTFVDDTKTLNGDVEVSVVSVGSRRALVLKNPGSNLTAQTGLGWKIVDPNEPDKLLASGRTNVDPNSGAGTRLLPANFVEGKRYLLYVWGQQDGSPSAGWTNIATVPQKIMIRNSIPDYGPDSYYSSVADSATPIKNGSWSAARRILYGKQRDATYSGTSTYSNANVSPGYKMLAKGPIASVADSSPFNTANMSDANRSASTSVGKDEALLWADNVATAGIQFDSTASNSNTFDSSTGPFQSLLAKTADTVNALTDVVGANYSSFEQAMLRTDSIEGVCTKEQALGCTVEGNGEADDGTYLQQSASNYPYTVFPLSAGDLRQFTNISNGGSGAGNTKIACLSNNCLNSTSGFWLRSANWGSATDAFSVSGNGAVSGAATNVNTNGLRPAMRLDLNNVILTARSTNQAQSTTDDLRLTFVDNGGYDNTPKTLNGAVSATVTESGGVYTLAISGSGSNLSSQTGYGWKLTYPDSPNNVLASGRTNNDAVTGAGNMTLPNDLLLSTEYDLQVWGQQDGSPTTGWSNIATIPQVLSITLPSPDYGPDGYYSTLDEDGAKPVVEGSWANTRRIMFGKQKDGGSFSSTVTYGNAKVDAGYKTVGFGGTDGIASVSGTLNTGGSPPTQTSATTTVQKRQALLWADHVATSPFAFDTLPNDYTNTFDAGGVDSYKSNVAEVSLSVAGANYSALERSVLKRAVVEGVCTASRDIGCGTGADGTMQESNSVNKYQIFPLSIGDMQQYLGVSAYDIASGSLAQRAGIDSNGAYGTWLRTGRWDDAQDGNVVGAEQDNADGVVTNLDAIDTGTVGLRPAMRVNLETLVLSASHVDQSQNADDDLRLTFVDSSKTLDDGDVEVGDFVKNRGFKVTVSGSHTLDGGANYGWKLVDANDVDGDSDTSEVVASGRSSSGGNEYIPTDVADGEYELWYWGQEDGTASGGWSNKATVPATETVTLQKPPPPDYGPDGYYSELADGELPVVDNGWADTRRIMFGKQRDTGSYPSTSTYGNKLVSGGYKTLAKGALASVDDANPSSDSSDAAEHKSATTAIEDDEALVWADDVVTGGFAFSTVNSTDCYNYSCNTFDAAGYMSNLATVAGPTNSTGAPLAASVADVNYSPFEKTLLRAASIEGVCTNASTVGCGSQTQHGANKGSYLQQTSSLNRYTIFPLSLGDMSAYLGHTSADALDDDLLCRSNSAGSVPGSCANTTEGFWLRSAQWNSSANAYQVLASSKLLGFGTFGTGYGLRPAMRLDLNPLVLSASHVDQSQDPDDDLRLTFVDEDYVLTDGGASVGDVDETDGYPVTVSGTHGLGSEYGWKLVDGNNKVVASGRSSSGGNGFIPTDVAEGEYELWYWGQADGTAGAGWSNKATVPERMSVTLRDPAPDYGPDGYYSELVDGALPVVTKGWANTRRIMFGKQKDDGAFSSTQTFGDAKVAAGYKTLGFGGSTGIASEDDVSVSSGSETYFKSATSQVIGDEALLWAENVETQYFSFDPNASNKNTFDSVTGNYQSPLAEAADNRDPDISDVANTNYSSFEQGLLRAAPVEGVCVNAQSVGCGQDAVHGTDAGSYLQQQDSVNSYKVFPLSAGDIGKYLNYSAIFNASDNLACPSEQCANTTYGIGGTWLRTAFWNNANGAYVVTGDGKLTNWDTDSSNYGLRPAMRVDLRPLVLSASHEDQTQNATDDLRLTFVDATEQLTGDPSAELDGHEVSITGTHALDASGNLGWKLVDGNNKVVASGSKDDNTMTIPDEVPAGTYDLWYWGQQDGTATEGWSNRATVPLKVQVTVTAPLTHLPYTGSSMFWMMLLALLVLLVMVIAYIAHHHAEGRPFGGAFGGAFRGAALSGGSGWSSSQRPPRHLRQ
ncbi:DUF6273 domain-containing protein [Bifidobacterium aquikefiri]|uniref:DUF6273 domain-containing protein n=2 Tax=Bifidobacterium aquikefiri TaxID=1653207 RepID=UPI0039E9F350